MKMKMKISSLKKLNKNIDVTDPYLKGKKERTYLRALMMMLLQRVLTLGGGQTRGPEIGIHWNIRI